MVSLEIKLVLPFPATQDPYLYYPGLIVYRVELLSLGCFWGACSGVQVTVLE